MNETQTATSAHLSPAPRVKSLEAELSEQADQHDAEQADQHDAELGRLRERIAQLEVQLAAKDGGQVATEGAENV